jgi:hypothetical protein
LVDAVPDALLRERTPQAAAIEAWRASIPAVAASG